MKQFWVYLFTYGLLIVGCQVKNTNNSNNKVVNRDSLQYKEVVLSNNFADTCFVFKDNKGDTISFNRNFEIVENTFGDTMNIGFNAVRPGETKTYFNYQIDTTRGGLRNSEEYKQYLQEGDLPELYTKWLCLYNLNIRWWGKTTRTGQMKIKVYYKSKESNTSTKK